MVSRCGASGGPRCQLAGTQALLGIAGAIFGSWVLRLLGIYTSGGLVPSILVAILGAVLLVVIVRALKKA